ncbi:hypothetical protein DL93DRAFT_2166322 [Clavulina sp. PMI_390]|nr:hypothetical protein DL93DRAFT_2166322 [Clavulina sp. PMI_390]
MSTAAPPEPIPARDPKIDTIGPDMSTSKVGGVPPERPEGAPANTPRFMTATWKDDPDMTRFGGKSFWGFLADQLRYKGPQIPREGKMAVHSYWSQHTFVLPRALAPMLLQYFSMQVLGYSWPLPVAFLIYSVSFILFAINMLHEYNRLAEKHGFLDAQAPRDNVPDVRLTSTSIGLLLTVTVRPLLGCFVAYKRYELPYLSLWTPVHMFMYTCILDFWFYVYHRAMHEVDFLWRFHKTHHMTKHPNPLLSAFADPEQDLFDILIIPLMTYLTYPLPFHLWWLTTVYILYIEAAGHTGIRIYWLSPVTGPVLAPLGLDLILEDHDLHHRNGWRKSSNYGKQTRIWDVLFGSTRSRLEMVPENIDWSNKE